MSERFEHKEYGRGRLTRWHDKALRVLSLDATIAFGSIRAADNYTEYQRIWHKLIISIIHWLCLVERTLETDPMEARLLPVEISRSLLAAQKTLPDPCLRAHSASFLVRWFRIQLMVEIVFQVRVISDLKWC